MAVLVALIFALFAVVVVAGLAIYGDRTIRLLVLVAFLASLAFMVWWWSLPETPDITNDPQPVSTTAP